MIHLPTNDELANLRMTFPLYQAPLRTLTDLAGPGLCSIDGNRHEHRFILGIGSDLIIPCPSCGQPTDLDVQMLRRKLARIVPIRSLFLRRGKVKIHLQSATDVSVRAKQPLRTIPNLGWCDGRMRLAA